MNEPYVSGEGYREQLIRMVKATAQEMMERAEDLVGDGDLISNFSIWFSFPQGGLLPTIEVHREHISRKAWEIYTGKPQKE